MSKEFKRQDSVRYSRLGLRRKKLQKWRRPRGIDSKMRLKRKSYPKTVSIGYKRKKTPMPVLIHNLKELNSLDKNATVILARIGAKKKLELIKAAEEKKIKIVNIGGSKWN